MGIHTVYFYQAVVRVNKMNTHVHSQVFYTKEDAALELAKNPSYELLGFVEVQYEKNSEASNG